MNLLEKWKRAQAIIQDDAVSASGKLMYIRLLEYANSKTGLCHPGVPRLGRDLGTSTRNARKLVGELEKLGWVARRFSAGPMGTNLYQVGVRDIPQGPLPPEISRRLPRSIPTGKPIEGTNIQRIDKFGRQRLSPETASGGHVFAKKRGALETEVNRRLGRDREDLLFAIREADWKRATRQLLNGAPLETVATELIEAVQ